MRKTLVIAECGSCHDGELTKAFALIDNAREVGADVAKFQWWSNAQRLAERRHAQELAAMYARYQVPRDWLSLLTDKARVAGIEFMCTTYLPEDIAVVDPFVKRFKIASFERTDWPFVAAHAPFAKPLIISCGMNDGRAVGVPPNATYLVCTSSYPAPIDELGLSRIRLHADQTGFSDHSAAEFTWTGALAVAAGAIIVERHIRLDETRPENPDYPHAMPPAAFRDYVRHIRFAESCLGNGWIGVQPSEESMLKYRVTGDG